MITLETNSHSKTTEIKIYKNLIDRLEEEFTKLYDSKSFAAIDEN